MFPLRNNFRAGLPASTLESTWLNTVANIFNDIEGEGCRFEKPMGGEGMGWKLIIDSAIDSDYPFRVADITGGSVQVTVGRWTRNGIVTSLVPDSLKTYKTLSGIGADDYVYLQLQTTTTLDPALKPNKVVVLSSATYPTDVTDYGINFVIGKFDTSVFTQYWFGGDIDDCMFRPDAEPFDSASYRSTIEHVPSDNNNNGSLQLYDVEGVSSSTLSVPYFSSDAGSPIKGGLEWAAIDSHFTLTPTQYSLQVHSPGTGSGWLQLFDFDDGGTALIPADYTAFYDTLVTESKLAVLVRDNTGATPILRYASLSDFKAIAAVDADTVGGVSPGDFLTETEADGLYWKQGDDETTCWGTAIGNSATNSVINLTDYQLVNAANINSVDWDAYTLVDSGNAIAVDWLNKKLGDSADRYTVEWEACILNGWASLVLKPSINWLDRKLFASDGTTSVLEYSTQAAAIADATDAASVITQLNDLLAKLRTYKLIAT